MLAALLVCAATVLAAATPGVVLAVQDLSDARGQVADARLAAGATLLAHALADERDALAADARSADRGAGLSAAGRARTDRHLADVTAGAPAELRGTLAGLPAARQRALTADGSPRTVVAAYQPLIDALGRVTGPVTTPLGRATGAAAVQRGLLVAALTGDGGQPALVADAQAARLQEQAALADFRAAAPAATRGHYDRTVSGPDSDLADRYLARLLGRSQLTAADRALGTGQVRSALTARISLMRGVEASAAADETRVAVRHRDHRTTVLELRVALAALCLLLLAGVLATLFRGLTRPLAALHRWSRADPESGEGAEVTGADEFTAVARRANALTHEAQALRARTRELAAEHAASLSARKALAAERQVLLRTQNDLLRSRDALARQLTEATVRGAAHLTYVTLGLRTLGLVERQLALIEGLEDQEQDPDQLEALFKLDHLATRMRRNSENLLVLTGTEPPPAFGGGTAGHGDRARPVVLVDVARAAISEIERYQRVRIRAVPEVRVAGRAADDISHLLAELLDNATAFSEPTAEVSLSGRPLGNGDLVLSVEDTGIGMPPERMGELNALLAAADPAPPGAVSGMGMYVVARLAHRHGVRVQLRRREEGGTVAVVVLPQPLLPAAGTDEQPATPVEAAIAGDPGRGSAVLPGSEPRGLPAQRVAPAEHSRPGPETETLTSKGLPQRVPRGLGLGGAPVVPERPQGGHAVDAAELRRKLGGLQRGLRAGRRDAEEEMTGRQKKQGPQGQPASRGRQEGPQQREGPEPGQGQPGYAGGQSETVEEATR